MRKPLSQERVLAAALKLADKSGVSALSMRKLGQQLGVEAMSLYKHVTDKEAVLSGLVDRVVLQIEVPQPGTPWKPALKTRATSAREALLRHPWALPLMHDLKPTDVRLSHNDRVLGLLREGGCDLKLAYRALLLLDSYVYGFVAQELSWQSENPEAVDAMQAKALVETYPYFGEVLGHVTKLVEASGARAAYDAEFHFGLELILATLDQSSRSVVRKRLPVRS
ncbi:MAG: hypothetical protein RJA70_632 [Pseudomonadota bacterium]|jgi:AcrR family transcriptional regulator